MPDFVLANTTPGSPPLVPEITLRLAAEPFDLWERIGENLPYWAFAWPGGQAVARYVLDNSTLTAGRTVLDLASGSGLVAIAAAMTGATTVTATDIDPLAIQAINTNAQANKVSVTAHHTDILDAPTVEADIILAGDVCYDRTMTARVLPFLARMATQGIEVILGDPGRPHFPHTGCTALTSYDVRATAALEAHDTTPTTVWRHDRG